MHTQCVAWPAFVCPLQGSQQLADLHGNGQVSTALMHRQCP